jgi:signal peptidase II
MMSKISHVLLAATILSSCVGCDQATKALAAKSLRSSPPQTYLAGTVRLELALNPGGFLSLGSNLPEPYRAWIFIGTNVCLMLVVVLFLVFERNVSLSLFVALLYVLAGGIGNMIDRVCNNGLVTDFLNLGIGPIRTGIFNVADVAVTFGALAAVLLMPREHSSK